MIVKKYLELLYFGIYFSVWRFDRFCNRVLNPLGRWLLVIIPNLFPFIKRNLRKQGRTPEQNADYILQHNSKLSDANVGHLFESGIGTLLSVFYCFVLTDIFLAIRFIFGKDLWIIQIDRAHSKTIGGFIVIMSLVLAFLTMGYVGNDEIIKRNRQRVNKIGRKSFCIFWGSFIVAALSFYFLLY